MNGIITTKTWSGFVHHAWMPCGRPLMIDAKIMSEMPLPMPRWVMSSPSHMTRMQPHVRQVTMRNTVAALKSSMSGWPADAVNDRNRKT
jgi:hypothetical protein